MGQTRLFIVSDEATAGKIAREYENHFEEDGFPVALFETALDSADWAVSIYVDDHDTSAISAKMKELASQIGFDLEIEEEKLIETNWVAHTLEALSPVEAGRFIVHGSHDSDKPKPHQHAICIDAGLAFGTGHHGTTAGCLQMLERSLIGNKFHNALDVGTGSGVLAIAIAKSAHIPVLASDIDPIATTTAIENCRKNGVGSLVKCVTSTGFNHLEFGIRRPFDLIIANILARPLEKLAPAMAAHSAANATVILSGLLPHQKARIVSAYRQQGFALKTSLIRDGWLVLVLVSKTIPEH